MLQVLQHQLVVFLLVLHVALQFFDLLFFQLDLLLQLFLSQPTRIGQTLLLTGQLLDLLQQFLRRVFAEFCLQETVLLDEL